MRFYNIWKDIDVTEGKPKPTISNNIQTGTGNQKNKESHVIDYRDTLARWLRSREWVTWLDDSGGE